MRLTGMVAGAALLADCRGQEPASPADARPANGDARQVPAPPAPLKSGSREFRDWRAVCDNGRRCMTYSGSGTGGWLAVRVEAGPDARPGILMDLTQISGTPLTLVIDGRSQTLIPPADGTVGFREPVGDTLVAHDLAHP